MFLFNLNPSTFYPDKVRIKIIINMTASAINVFTTFYQILNTCKHINNVLDSKWLYKVKVHV